MLGHAVHWRCTCCRIEHSSTLLGNRSNLTCYYYYYYYYYYYCCYYHYYYDYYYYYYDYYYYYYNYIIQCSKSSFAMFAPVA